MPRSNDRKQGKTRDLHGSAPDESRVVLLVIDMINAFDFDGARGKPIAELLKPDDEDYFVLKPKHSGFQFTTLDVLLAHLGAERLILTGVAANFCVLFTAHDAYMRDYHLIVPRDCVASQTEADDESALAHMAKVTKADVRPSSEIDFSALQK